MNENHSDANGFDGLDEKQAGISGQMHREEVIDRLRQILDVRHPESEEFEPAFRAAVWAVMAAEEKARKKAAAAPDKERVRAYIETLWTLPVPEVVDGDCLTLLANLADDLTHYAHAAKGL